MCITCAAAARRRHAAALRLGGLVSTFDPYAYLDAAATALELPIPAKYRDGVAANLARLHEMARDVIEFPLPCPDTADTASPGSDQVS